MNGYVRPGTPRVHGNPTPHCGHGRQRGQAVKAAQHPKGLAFTDWHRCCTLAVQEGWGFPAMRQRAVHDSAGTGTKLATNASTQAAQRRGGGNPLGGWTGRTGAAWARKRQAHRVGGGTHVVTARSA